MSRSSVPKFLIIHSSIFLERLPCCGSKGTLHFTSVLRAREAVTVKNKANVVLVLRESSSWRRHSKQTATVCLQKGPQKDEPVAGGPGEADHRGGAEEGLSEAKLMLGKK